MSKYVIFTDSSCDLAPEVLADWGVESLSLTFRFNDSEKEYYNGDMNIADFYQKMRDGGVAKTSAVNTQAFKDAFEKILADGKDVLYIGFSSGLSTTCNSAATAAKMLCGEFPERKIITVDSLAASAGLGLLVKLAVDKREAGEPIEDVASYIEGLKLRLCHWFTVEDLVYLKRGGRVSPTVAFVGNMLGIKPVMHVDNEGHLINVAKARGRRAAVDALFDKAKNTMIGERANSSVFISHGDCIEDAEYLAERIKNEIGVKEVRIAYVGSVIGSHSGPGTLALFFLGSER